MAWETPKQDWEAGDAPSSGDFNRLEGNTKHLKDLLGVASGIATLGADGKVPQAQLPTSVEIKTIRVSGESVPANGKLTKTITFDNYHKVVFVGARHKTELIGTFIMLINAGESVTSPAGLSLSVEYDGTLSPFVGTGSMGGSVFGQDIGFETSFSNKTFTFSFKNSYSGAQNVSADINIIAL